MTAGFPLLPPAGGIFYHYTSRAAAQEMSIAIPYADLPKDSDGLPAAEYRGVVQTVLAVRGRALRRGGGHEWVVHQPIPLHAMPWSWTVLEAPE